MTHLLEMFHDCVLTFSGRASFEELYRELLATKEAKAEVERSRDEAVSRARELELKYQDLLLE